ncbi:MAG: hypothetical protein RIR46_1238 [Actinomycetota bacterium]|jgi:polyhydroxyalkanoate synthesis regulator phasin
MNTTPFGHADNDGNVFIIEAGVERKVGQMPGKTTEEALSFFMRKFDDLATQVRILEQRVTSGADIESVEKSHAKISAELVGANVVGDLAALQARVTALVPAFEGLREAKKAASAAASAESLAKRDEIVTKAEALANADHSKTIWKTASAEFAALFESWQALQKAGARVSKSEADALWKRFSTARTKFETAKRAFFAQTDAANREAKAKKVALVEAAEKLAEAGDDKSVEYRKLLDAWKASGRSNSKVDDALWLRFKTAGDIVYQAKAAKNAEMAVDFAAAKATKEALLVEAKKIDPAKNLSEAKRALGDIQKRWEKAGKVAREDMRNLEDGLKAVERQVRDFESEQWRKSDPATKARTNSVLEQLETSIAKLQAELTAAEASKDAKKIEAAKQALEARKAWLEVVKASA